MKGTNEFVLYLDFDGVLHHENCLWHPEKGAYLCAPSRYSLFQHSTLLEQTLEPFPEVNIVLSTSWLIRYGFDATTKRLTLPLQARVIGGTFHSRAMHEDEFRSMPRGQQVHEDVLRRRPRNWLALDDDAHGWHPEHAARFVQTHMHDGLSEPAVLDEFKRKLREMCK